MIISVFWNMNNNFLSILYMKYIHHVAIVTIIAFLASNVSAVPQLPSKCEAFKPQVLLSYTVKESQLEELVSIQKKKKTSVWGQTESNTGRYWFAYSDRSNNTTYETPGGAECGKLKFGERVCIAQIEDAYALVYVEQQSGVRYPTISRRAKCKGWIPMSNLLLWSDCPTNEYGIYNKALIVANVDKLQSDNYVGNYYTNPTTLEGKAKLHSTMNFFFAMKKDPETGLVLLAKESRVEGNIKNVLYGWVSEGMYAPWSQRTCLEPNWDKKVLEDIRGEKVPVYTDNSGSSDNIATRIGIGERRNSVSGNNPATEYRLDPNILRYPLLENDRENGLYKITAFTRSGNSASTSSSTMAVAAAAETELLKSLDALRVVNIIVVIDGTKGMEKFFPAALEAIRRANEYFGKENRNVRAGVVIYRDYTDGNYVTEYLPMRSATDVSISNFLRAGGRYGIKSSANDMTDSEALYKGLEVALDAKKMGYSKDNSNLMFVIGDCGNDLADTKCLSQEEIIKRCVDNRIQLQSFQVKNVQKKEYNMFRKQMGDIVVENMKRQYAKLGSGIKLTYKELEDGYDAVFDVAKESTFFIGGIRNANNGQEMDASRLYALVMNTSNKFNSAIDNQESKHTTEAITDDALTQIDMNFMKGRISAKSIEVLRESKYLTAFEGYVPVTSQNGREYWQPIVYISQPEFLQLMEYLKPVMEAINTRSENRKPYVDAMKALVRSMLPDISESDMNEMSNTEIMNMVTGLNVRTQALESHSLVDIQSEQKVSKQQYDGIMQQFSAAYKKLEIIRSKPYAFSTRRNGVRWYWIPAADLP